MDILWGIVVAVILGIWLSASVLGQIPKPQLQRLRQLDVFGLIPHWSFFAPRPSQSDFYLLYRDQLSDGALTEWTEVKIIEPRRWSCMLWNPSRREKKVLFDAVNGLFRDAYQFDAYRANAQALQLSLSYLLLLKYISDLSHYQASLATQFLLMVSQGKTPEEKKPIPLFLSQLHQL